MAIILYKMQAHNIHTVLYGISVNYMFTDYTEHNKYSSICLFKIKLVEKNISQIMSFGVLIL